MKMEQQIETSRLIIRRFNEDDWRDLHEYLSDEEVVFYEPYGTFNEEACKKEATIRAKDGRFLAVCIKKTGKVIGNLYMEKQDFNTWELGYVFNKKFEKKGFATESVEKIMNLYGQIRMNMAFYQKRGVIKVISGIQIRDMQDLDIDDISIPSLI